MHLFRILLIVCLVGIGATAVFKTNAQQPKVGQYTFAIANKTIFDLYKGAPLNSMYSDVESVKLCYELKTKKLYFINSTKYKFHIDFVKAVFNYAKEIGDFNADNYTNTSDREYILSTINFYKQQNKYTLEFVSEDDLPLAGLTEMYDSLLQHWAIKAPVYLLVNNAYLSDLANKKLLQAPLIFPESIFAKQVTQLIVLGTSYGYARKYNATNKAMQYQNDIVFFEGTPLTIPNCKGVITNTFQTPLSHINVLCNNRKIPAAAVANYDSLLTALDAYNKPITLIVTLKGIEIKVVSEQELREKLVRKKATKLVLLPADVKYKLLPNFATENIKNKNAIGGKAFGLKRLYNIQKNHPAQFKVPEGAFAIPFYYYAKHIATPNVQQKINALLAYTNTTDSVQLQLLKAVRKSILEAPLDKNLLASVKNKLQKSGAQFSYRFRSSSNAEDAENFNGAGLYESYSGSLVNPKKDVEKAIKKVWASVWTDAAFAERNIFGLNNKSVMMAVLVHRGFPDEDANGVAITKNLYRDNFPGFTINVQKLEVSVVAPPDSVICDQFTCIGSENFTGEPGKVFAQYITRSNINNGQNVLTELQIEKLYKALKTIKDIFYYTENARVILQISFENYALDLEFKFQKDVLYIKQVRSYK